MKKQLISAILIVTVILALAAFVVGAQDSEQPFLGIMFGESADGALVTRVLRDTPAAQAGLEAGDIITALNGDNVTVETLADAVGNLSVGDTVTLDVMRNGEPLEIDATLAAQPETPTFQINPSRMVRPWLGVGLSQSDEGIVIDNVAEGSPAADAGLQPGDMLSAINGESIETTADAATMISDLQPGDVVTLSITREGEALDIEATLGSMMERNFSMTTNSDVVIFDGENWRIVALSDGSSLAEAGLRAGDVITAINGESLDFEGLSALLGDMAEDATVALTVERDGTSQEMEVPVSALSAFNTFNFGMGMGQPFGEFRGPRGERIPFNFGMMPTNVRLGVQFTDIDADVAAANDLSVTEGALITDVQPDSPAAIAGLEKDDVVVSVNGDVIDAQRTLRERLFAYEPGDVVTLEVLRDGETLMLDVTLGSGIDMGNLPFELGRDGALRFFFGPNGEFNFEHPPFESQPVVPAANA